MKLRQFIYVIAIIALASGCKKDFLEVPTKNVVLRQSYVIDLNTTGDYLNGIYIDLARSISNTGLNYAELIADNIRPTSNAPVFTSFYNWNQQADDSKTAGIVATGMNANGFWVTGIKIARECSFVIENADKYKDQDPEKADNFKGQAYAMRAFIHSMMVNIFAQSYAFTTDASHPGTPYITTSDWTQPATRLTVAEVYNAMITDLNSAIQLLPAVQVVPSPDFAHSRWNKTGAKALLARIHLFRQDWLSAKDLAREVSTTVPIMTGAGNYPSKLFTNKEAEALFQLPPSSSATTAGAGSYTIQFSASWYSGTTYYLVASSGIASLLRENPADARGVWLKDTTNSNIAIKKFPANVIPGFTMPSVSYFQTLIRSSEMYLTAAEAYARLQKYDSAVYYLDAIRKRAVPLAPVTTATGAALLDSIYKERRKELAFEGLRMFDIQRWKQTVNRSTDAPVNTRTLLYGSDKAIAPIPTSDVLQVGMAQNTGY